MEMGPIVLVAVLASATVQNNDNTFNRQYKDRAAVAAAERLENPANAVFRYRVAIAGMLQLKPGMTAAEIGARSGFVSRELAQKVGPSGRTIAVERDAAMVAYLNERARAEGIANFTAIAAPASGTGIEAGTVDAIAVVNAVSTFQNPEEMLAAIAATLKPAGILVVVDFAREGQGAQARGMDAEDVLALAAKAGFDRTGENNIVPGHYSLIFKKR